MKQKLVIFFSYFLLFIFASCEKSVYLEEETTEKPILAVSQGNRAVSNEVYVHPFSELRIGKSEITTFTIANRGKKDLIIGNVSSDTKTFVVAPPSKKVLKPNETVNFTVKFTPDKWGQEVGKISFFTNDKKVNTFSFLVMGSGSMAAQFKTDNYIIDTPEGINTVPFGDADGNGTRFITAVPIDDPNGVINQDVKLIVNLTFEDGTKGQVIKTMYEVGTGALKVIDKVLYYGFSIRFGSKNTYVDVEAYLQFANGETSNRLKYRIIRPLGAN